MAGILWTLAALFLLAACHPFVTYPLSLRLLRIVRPRPLRRVPSDADDPIPTFAVCVCAYNEAANIAATTIPA